LLLTPRKSERRFEADIMFKGFAAFLSRGNVIDLAVAVVVGGAFGAVVTALVKDLITPLIAAVAGKPNFGSLHFTMHHSVFAYGDFLNALVSFVTISAAIYYIIVLPAQKLIGLRRGPIEPTVTVCPECLSEIPLAATRCKYCTAVQPGQA
jgi:large conductance mechanosensitive channel